MFISRNHRSLSSRIFTATNTNSHLQEANLRILDSAECEKLGKYKNEKTKKQVKVNLDVELCAARVVRKNPPEKWFKIKTASEDGGEESGKITYAKQNEDTKPSSETFFYGGIIEFFAMLILITTMRIGLTVFLHR